MFTHFQKNKLDYLQALGIVSSFEFFQGILVVTTSECPEDFSGHGIDRFNCDGSQGFFIPAEPVNPCASVPKSVLSRARGSLNDFI